MENLIKRQQEHRQFRISLGKNKLTFSRNTVHCKYFTIKSTAFQKQHEWTHSQKLKVRPFNYFWLESICLIGFHTHTKAFSLVCLFTHLF